MKYAKTVYANDAANARKFPILSECDEPPKGNTPNQGYKKPLPLALNAPTLDVVSEMALAQCSVAEPRATPLKIRLGFENRPTFRAVALLLHGYAMMSLMLLEAPTSHLQQCVMNNKISLGMRKK
jgi:hypothetical protein